MASTLKRRPAVQPRTGLEDSTQPVKPAVVWLWVGVVLALFGIAGGLTLAAMGLLQGDGPKRIASAQFPGTVRFNLDEPVDELVVYLEFPALGSSVEAPPHLSPIVTRNRQEVIVDTVTNVRPYSGLSTTMDPIGTFRGSAGHYAVTVDQDSGGGSASIVVANPAESTNGHSKVLMGSLGGVVLFFVGSLLAVYVGRARSRSRQKLPVLVPPIDYDNL